MFFALSGLFSQCSLIIFPWCFIWEFDERLKFNLIWNISCSFVGPTLPASIVQALPSSSTTIYLIWTDIPKSGTGGHLNGYLIKYKTYLDTTFSEKRVFFGYTSSTITDLEPFTLYWVDLYGFNEGGISPPANVILKTLEGGLGINILVLQM